MELLKRLVRLVLLALLALLELLVLLELMVLLEPGMSPSYALIVAIPGTAGMNFERLMSFDIRLR